MAVKVRLLGSTVAADVCPSPQSTSTVCVSPASGSLNEPLSVTYSFSLIDESLTIRSMIDGASLTATTETVDVATGLLWAPLVTRNSTVRAGVSFGSCDVLS